MRGRAGADGGTVDSFSPLAYRDAAVAIVAGGALGASFVDFRLFVLPWLAIAPLLAIIESARPRYALRLGWLAGMIGIGLAFAWLVYAFRVFGGFPLPVAVLLYLPLVAWMGFEIGLFTTLVAWLGPLPFGLTAPLAFTAVEFLFPSLFPWRLAHSQYRLPTLLQTGELAGPSLLGFTVVWVNAAVLAAGRALVGRRAGGGAAPPRATRGMPLTIALPLLLAATLAAFGAWRLADVRAARARAPALRVGVVQGNISIEHKGDRAFFGRNLDAYRDASRAIADDVDLLIWPETVFQHRIAAERARLDGDDDPFSGAPRPLLFGGLAIAYGDGGPARVYNSAFLRGADGHVAGRYDKRVLVPFGEYMPLGDRIPRLRELSPATSNFAAGGEPAVLMLDPSARLGALICYEDVIPGPARAAAAKGATLLVNLTNDAWYGDGAEPLQHQALAIWRTVETRRDLVRATNSGWTSVLAATGEVMAELPTFRLGTLTTEVRLLSGTTVYTAVGDVFAWAVVMIVAGASALRSRKARPGPSGSRRRSRRTGRARAHR
ncbi:MAG: apolipoprotein N-acyltransferase [Deltaproteobacteria bacterium]|nr:apolipoprotein N-acyltransferase [Deltaproteobacteria bacterium]